MMAGVDEAGRGPLAGPVVAAAVILDDARRIRNVCVNSGSVRPGSGEHARERQYAGQ